MQIMQVKCRSHKFVLHKLHMQIPLGILLKNENKYEDMIDILDHCHRYVPGKIYTHHVTVPGGESDISFEDKHLLTILCGGDQLSAVRARGSKSIRQNSDTSEQRLDGLLPISEDWHGKVVFLEVSIVCSYIVHAYDILVYACMYKQSIISACDVQEYLIYPYVYITNKVHTAHVHVCECELS